MAHRGSALAGLVAGLVAGLIGLTLAACGGDDPPAADPSTTPAESASASAAAPTTTPPDPTPSGTPSVAPPTDPAIVFAADGIGPYVIGSSLADLTTQGLVTGVVESELCANTKGATATGRYAGKLSLTFTGDQLTSIHTTSTDLITPSGARVGQSLAELRIIYGSRGAVITGTLGNQAMVVRVPTSILAIVFYLDASNTRVASMSAGNADTLEDAARTGEGC
jgi:hypothetical protein